MTIGCEMFTRFSAHSTIENVTGLSVSLPLSTFEISRMSLISVSRWLLARLILRRLSRTAAVSSTFLAAIVVNPMIAFIGVRISCDIVERKSVFAWLARSAATAAARSSRLNCCMLKRLNMRRSKSPSAIIPASVQLTSLYPSASIPIIVTRTQSSVELIRVCATRLSAPEEFRIVSTPESPSILAVTRSSSLLVGLL